MNDQVDQKPVAKEDLPEFLRRNQNSSQERTESNKGAEAPTEQPSQD